MTPIIGPLDGDWSRWGSPLDRKRDTLAVVLQARALPMDGARIRALDERAVDAELAGRVYELLWQRLAPTEA